MDFKTICNFISKSVIWNKVNAEIDKNGTQVARWISDEGATISISECADYDAAFVVIRPGPSAQEISLKRGYLTIHEANYVNGMLLRRQSGAFREKWPLSITTEMRGGDKYINIKTTFDTTDPKQTSWKHTVTALPGDGKASINYEAASAGTDGTKLHNTLVQRIYKQLMWEPEKRDLLTP